MAQRLAATEPCTMRASAASINVQPRLPRRSVVVTPVRAAAKPVAGNTTVNPEAQRQQLALRTTALFSGAMLATFSAAGAALAGEVMTGGSGSVDVSSLLPGVDPTLLFGGVAVLGGGAVIAGAVNAVSGGSKVKSTTPESVLEAVEQEPKVVILDIRPKEVVKQEGSPDIKKRRPVAVPFTQIIDEEVVVVEGWAEKAKNAIKPDSIVILLDTAGKDAPRAGKALAEVVEEVEDIFFVGGGAQGWKESGAPWKEPSKGLSLPSLSLPNLSSLKADALLGEGLDSVAEGLKTTPDAVKGALTVGGLVLGGALLLTEVEVLLQLVGVVAAGQFLATRLLFAKDRAQTIKEVKELVDSKIAAGSAGEDLKKLATTVLEIKVKNPPTGTTKISAGMLGTTPKAAAATAGEPAAAPAPAPAPAKAAAIICAKCA